VILVALLILELFNDAASNAVVNGLEKDEKLIMNGVLERLSKATITAGNTTATAPSPECRPTGLLLHQAAGSCAKAPCEEDVKSDRTFILISVTYLLMELSHI
jgi:hypothetical protein